MNLNRLRCATFSSLLSIVIAATSVMSLPVYSQSEETVQSETTSAPHAALNDMITMYTPADTSVIVPIIALLLVFGGPIFIVAMLLLKRYRSLQQAINFRRDCITKLIDAGKDIPETLFFPEDTPTSAHKDLSLGIKNIGLGLGIAIFLTAVNGLAAGSFGLILVGLGSAQLLSWRLTRKTD